MFSRTVTTLAVVLALIGLLVLADGAFAASGAELAEEGGHGASLNPIESWRADLAIWTGVIFVVLLFVLGKFAWGPIADGLDKREQRIASEITAAEKANTDAKTLLGEYQQKLVASGQEIRQMIEDGKHEAQQQGQEIVQKARSEADVERRRALVDIDLATAGALKELAEQSATLAVDLAGKIVHAQLDRDAHADLIRQAVAEFSQATPSKN